MCQPKHRLHFIPSTWVTLFWVYVRLSGQLAGQINGSVSTGLSAIFDGRSGPINNYNTTAGWYLHLFAQFLHILLSGSQLWITVCLCNVYRHVDEPVWVVYDLDSATAANAMETLLSNICSNPKVLTSARLRGDDLHCTRSKIHWTAVVALIMFWPVVWVD